MTMKNKSFCSNYCGISCVNGSCPNALDELDRSSDTDSYSSFHLDKPIHCKDCWCYRGCSDCYFFRDGRCFFK